MTISSVSQWSATTATDNTDLNDIPLGEGLTKGPHVNGAFREGMKQIAAYTRRGSDLASAATLNLDSIDTLLLNVTGTTTVTAVTLTSGHWRIVRATGAFQITAGASLIVNGSTSISYTTTAEDLLLFEGYGSSVVRVWALNRLNSGTLTAISTDAGAAAGPTLDLYRDSASPAANDVIGGVHFNGEDSAGNKQLYASIETTITDPTNGSEDSDISLWHMQAGTLTRALHATVSGGLPLLATPNNLYIDSASNARINLDKGASGDQSTITGKKAGADRWQIDFANTTAESGSNVGSDFTISRFNDAGTLIDSPFHIFRSSGVVQLPLGQLRFPAAQNASSEANTLDDYEEGSTTPTPTAGSGTFTSVSAALNYTKIGRLVTFSATITITTNGTAAGSIILPLPFTAAAASACSGIISTSGAAVQGLINASGTSVSIFKYDATYPGGSGAGMVVQGSFVV